MAEFFARQRLKDLGYTSKFDDLDEYKAKIFIQISTEIDKEKNLQARK